MFCSLYLVPRGRNQIGNVLWRRDEMAHSLGVTTEDNFYGYDGLSQVIGHQRGNLSAPPYTGIVSPVQTEGWNYDPTGNWRGYSETSPANNQTRTHNIANEITAINAAVGNVNPDYDPVGNMRTLPQDPGLSTAEYNLTWDAWNRLVAVKDGATPVAAYSYDGQFRQTKRTQASGSEHRHYYYNNQWRAVEERVEGAAYLVDRQYTW